MKNYIITFLAVLVLILGPVIVSWNQPLPNATGPDNVLPGSGAPVLNCPIGNGCWVLIALTFVYGAYKTWQIFSVKKPELF
jgi:hypothetical protein